MTDSEMEKPAIDAVLKRTGCHSHPGITSDGRMGVAGALARPVRGELALSSEISGTNSYALIAARLASHRPNPLHSFDGSFRSILILDHAGPLACARTLPDTKPLNRWHTLPVLFDAALTVLASFY